MQDPHVENLTYTLVQQENITFAEGAHLREDHPGFVLDLKDNILTIELRDHYPSVEAARRVVDPFVRNWELWAALEHGFRKFRFTYKAADVIDRRPSPPGPSPQFIQAAAIGSATILASGSLRVERSSYPSPPNEFLASADVEILWHRFERYKSGREPLQGMAFSCLTKIVGMAGGNRPEAARQLFVSRTILDNIGRLTGDRYGDLTEARKYPASGTNTPLTDKQRRWLEAAIRLLIRRTGQLGALSGEPLPILDMSHLPDL